MYKILRPDLLEYIKRKGGYCLCAIEKSEDTKCICKAFKNGNETTCHCGVWEKTEDTNEVMNE